MTNSFRKLKLDELNRLSPDEFRETEKIPVIVVLDNIRSLHNIGSFFRTADAFRIKEVWLCGYTARPPHREISKTALGATETVSWRHFENAFDAISSAKKGGIELLAIEQSENSTALNEMKFSKYSEVGLIFGNEVDGVSQEFMENVVQVVEIPQEGSKHSLNVSISAGIVLWEAFKQFRK